MNGRRLLAALGSLSISAGRRSHALVWLLVVALAIYGHTATVVQLLGPAHRHEAETPGATSSVVMRVEGVFREIRAWRAQWRERLQPDLSSHVHAHAHVIWHEHALAEPLAHGHAAYERHRHDHGDATVVALDGTSGEVDIDTASAAAAGSATLPLATAPRWALPAPQGRATRWPCSPPRRWADALQRLPDRPPRA